MAFYQATGGMWTPFKRVAFGNLIEKGTSVEIAAPYTGTYLIATSKCAPRVPAYPAVESDIKQVIRWADRGNVLNNVYDFCSYSVIYAEKNQVIYSGTCEQASTVAIYAPSYCIYYLVGRKLSHTEINYIGCTSSDAYDPNSSAYQWGPELGIEEDNPHDDWKKWVKSVSNSCNLNGCKFPYSHPGTIGPTNPLNITDPNREYIIAILGGVGNSGGIPDYFLGGVNTRSASNNEFYSWADGMSLMYVPESTINSTENKVYNFLSYSDRQANGLVVDFYKFTDTVENLFVSLGVGTHGMGHLLKVTV